MSGAHSVIGSFEESNKAAMGPEPDPSNFEFAPFELINGDWSQGFLLVCDHASNAIPPIYENLGMPDEELGRHIAFDIGMRDLTIGLAGVLDAPAILSTYSRLLVDPNRGEDDPTVLMRLSDGAVVPGNRHADAAEREKRLDLYYRPYHDALTFGIDKMIAQSGHAILMSLHSFTANWRGVPRPWHVGVLWDRDDRISTPLIRLLEDEGDLVVGDNEPYTGRLVGDTMYRHGTLRGLPHALLEIRQDLVTTPKMVESWVMRLAPIFQSLISGTEKT